MKIAVYAICKNEAQFIDRWSSAVADADEVVVLDTGSTDASADLLREKGFRVYEQTITPWRFDAARNRSLALVSEDCDVCVCLDLDEVLCDGWRQALETAWARGADQLSYYYVWSFHPDGSEGIAFNITKIHARHGFTWVNPVHEVLVCDHEARLVEAPGLRVEHHPDPSKSRAQYLPLLELAVQENPRNDRNMHYLGREYLFHRRWHEAIDTLTRHLAMPEAAWPDEKSASCRYMAKAHLALGQAEQAEVCLYRAIALAPHLREAWLELAQLYYEREDWIGVAFCAERALRITERPLTYITEGECWGALPWDLMSLAQYHLGRPQEALSAAKQALAYAPNDQRLKDNLRFFEKTQAK